MIPVRYSNNFSHHNKALKIVNIADNKKCFYNIWELSQQLAQHSQTVLTVA